MSSLVSLDPPPLLPSVSPPAIEQGRRNRLATPGNFRYEGQKRVVTRYRYRNRFTFILFFFFSSPIFFSSSPFHSFLLLLASSCSSSSFLNSRDSPSTPLSRFDDPWNQRRGGSNNAPDFAPPARSLFRQKRGGTR